MIESWGRADDAHEETLFDSDFADEGSTSRFLEAIWANLLISGSLMLQMFCLNLDLGPRSEA